MNQCSGSQRVSRSLVPKTLNCQPMEFIVNQRDELSSSPLFAGPQLVEQRRYIYRSGIQVSLRKTRPKRLGSQGILPHATA